MASEARETPPTFGKSSNSTISPALFSNTCIPALLLMLPAEASSHNCFQMQLARPHSRLKNAADTDSPDWENIYRKEVIRLVSGLCRVSIIDKLVPALTGPSLGAAYPLLPLS